MATYQTTSCHWDFFLSPCNPDVWECTDMARRNSSSVTLRIERVKEAVASTANPYHFRNINLNAVTIVSLTCWKRLLLHISPQAHLLLLFGDQCKTLWEGRLLAKLTNKRGEEYQPFYHQQSVKTVLATTIGKWIIC